MTQRVRGIEPRASILPQLSVRRGRAAVDFYTAAFGAVEDYRVGGTDEHEDVVAQLSIGTASFWVSDEAPSHGNFSPESLGGGTVRMLLIVEDPDSAIERAIAAGASEVFPVSEEHGWRLGRIEDPFGHHWEIGKPLIAWPTLSALPPTARPSETQIQDRWSELRPGVRLSAVDPPSDRRLAFPGGGPDPASDA